jgi:hypothetical protein
MESLLKDVSDRKHSESWSESGKESNFSSRKSHAKLIPNILNKFGISRLEYILLHDVAEEVCICRTQIADRPPHSMYNSGDNGM